MCNSLAEGGQRCSAHTRQKLAAKAAIVQKAVAANDRKALVEAQIEWETAASEYASTDAGHRHLKAQAEASDAAGDIATASLLNTVVARGEAMRAANRETAALIAAVRLAQTEPVPADERPSTRLAVPDANDDLIPRLSPREQTEWTDAVENLRSMQDRLNFRYSSWAHPITDMVESADEADEALGRLDTSDTEIAKRLMRVDKVWGDNRTAGPTFIRDENAADPDAEVEELRTRWNTWCEDHRGTLDGQFRRALDHPESGKRTFGFLRTQMPAETIAHPRCPTPVLVSHIRAGLNNSTHLDQITDDGWKSLRSRRIARDKFDNDAAALGMALAFADPDNMERHEAVNQVMTTPIEAFRREDRAYLVANLNRLPGRANQETLARSIVDYANGYADEDEQKDLHHFFTSDDYTRKQGTLGRSKNMLSPEVRALGEKIRVPDVPAAVAEPVAEKKPRRFWDR